MVWEEDDDEEQVTTEYLEEAVEKTTSLYRRQTAENFTNLRQIIVLTEFIFQGNLSSSRRGFTPYAERTIV